MTKDMAKDTAKAAGKFDPLLFCSEKEHGRFALDKPWPLDDGRLVATDARILIRFDRSLYDGPIGDGNRKMPKAEAERIVASFASVKEWFPTPAVPRCEKCGGNDMRKQGCKTCCGEGLVTCDACGHERVCDDCDGSGESIRWCDFCPDVMLGNRKIANRHHRQMVTLPNVQWGVANDDANAPLCFRFDGGDGCVMPLKQDEGDAAKRTR